MIPAALNVYMNFSRVNTEIGENLVVQVGASICF